MSQQNKYYANVEEGGVLSVHKESGRASQRIYLKGALENEKRERHVRQRENQVPRPGGCGGRARPEHFSGAGRPGGHARAQG